MFFCQDCQGLFMFNVFFCIDRLDDEDQYIFDFFCFIILILYFMFYIKRLENQCLYEIKIYICSYVED